MIDMSRIKDVVINEGITCFRQIKFYLAILVDKEDKMVVIFEVAFTTILKILLKVYRGTRSLIYAEEEEEEEAEESMK
ncbi:hypothetical protein BDF22DRAFT_698789 [Syncephalis plumigaleata]|nr:hypothetical protein BDF22DRAFT_698789 [Syncephalis plumigaleata]